MLQTKIKNALANNFVDILYCLFLFLIAFKFVHSLETIKDIELYDESFYLYRGVKILDLGIPQASWGPIYSIWYLCLSLFKSDNIDLFYLNFKSLIIIPPLLFYLYLRTLLIRPIISIFFAFAYCISGIALLTPRLGNFAALVLLLFLIIANLTKNNVRFYFLCAFAFLLISFIRPEYFLSFLIIFFTYLLFLFRSLFSGKIKIKNEVFQLFSILILLFILVVLSGNPLAGGRSFFAFSQHFAFFWMERNNIDSPNIDYYKVVMQAIFGDAQSISQALIANPREFLIHIKFNFFSYFHHSISILLVDLQNDFSTFVNIVIRRIELMVLFLVFLFIIFRNKILLRQINFPIFKRLSIVFICIFIPVFISSLLINPRFHYMPLQSILLLTIIAYALEKSLTQRFHKSKQKTIYLGFLALILLILTPNLATGWCLTNNLCLMQRISTTETLRLPNLKTIEFIRSLPINSDINMVEADGGYHIYLSDRYHYIPEAQKQESFFEFLEKQKVNAILLTPALAKDANFAEDEEFINFIDRSEQWNFVKLKIPKTQNSLFLSADLIQNDF